MHDNEKVAENDNDPVDDESEISTESLTVRHEHLLNNANFQRLRQFQEEIFTASEMTPSFRKVINALITEANLKTLKNKLLKEIS